MARVDDAYKTAKLPIFSSLNTSVGGSDSGTSNVPTIKNGVVETLVDPFSGNAINYVTQRPSFKLSDTITNGSVLYYHHSFYPYIALGTTIYKQAYGSSSSTIWAGTNSFTENGSRFTLIRDTINNNDVLGFVEGTTGKFVTINLSTDVATVQTAVSFVANPFVTTLDGYTFIAAEGTDEIYNSDLNDITSWNLGVNFIRSSSKPGHITGLANYKNYIIAFKETSCEFFYNAGLTATSPLQRNENLDLGIGCPYPWSIAAMSDTLVWIGRGEAGNTNSVFMLEGEKLSKISTSAIEKILKDNNDQSTGKNSRYYGTGSVAKLFGNTYYVLTFSRSISLAYCFESKMWAQWSVEGIDGAILDITDRVSSLGGPMFFFYTGTNVMFGGFTSNQLAYDTYGASDNRPIKTTIITPPIDFGTIKRKIISALRWIGSIEPSYNVKCSWSDDNQTTTSNNHVFPLGTNPTLRNLGQFRRREFNFEFINVLDINTPNTNSTTLLPRIRMEGIEVEYREGSS